MPARIFGSLPLSELLAVFRRTAPFEEGPMGFLVPLIASGWHYFFGILMFLTAVFLILLILVQRGRGGGLAGAFGGMGGQSAFGTKAGDLFTRLTMGAATFWIILCILAVSMLNRQVSVFGDSSGSPDASVESRPGEAGAPGATSTATPSASTTTGAGGATIQPSATNDNDSTSSTSGGGGESGSSTPAPTGSSSTAPVPAGNEE
jgi:preprotein translocase subunit SecG